MPLPKDKRICIHLGDVVSVREQVRNGLDRTKGWHYCGHPLLPLNRKEVNPCVGCCTDKCSGYTKVSDSNDDDSEGL